MNYLEMIGYLASAVMGIVLGLTGGGGSILAVPILVYLFGIEAVTATSYSLGIIGIISLWGAFGAHRSGDLKLSQGFYFGIPGIIGITLSRRVILPVIPDTFQFFNVTTSKSSLILVAFALLMLATSISMLRSLNIKKPQLSQSDNISISKTYLATVGLFVGMLSGFVGAGGGFLIVPALLSFAKLEMRKAAGTSLFIIAVNCLFGVLSDLHKLDGLNLKLFLVITVISVIGMTIGMKIRSSVSDSKLKFAFAVMVIVIAGFILRDQLIQFK